MDFQWISSFYNELVRGLGLTLQLLLISGFFGFLMAIGVALGRLSWGVLGYAAYLSSYLVAGRGRVLSRFESNPP